MRTQEITPFERLSLQSANLELSVFSLDDTKISKVEAPEAKVINLPSGTSLAELHVYFGEEFNEEFRNLSPPVRGRRAASLILEDWLLLADKTEAGAFPHIDGFEGTSPLARPRTMARLGVEARPASLNNDGLAHIGYEYRQATGESLPFQQAYHFVVSKEALVGSIPAAEQLLEKLY